MNGEYKTAFAGLNTLQKQAVEQIDGPVLVLAGPGTGKTQLISTRVGYILQHTDTPANAILLLTFTDAGVQAMRERLNRLIGPASYDVQLSTYHAFGGEIFRAYPDYLESAQLNLIEELGADTLLRDIIARLPYSNPLKFADTYINDLKSFISDCKRALLTPEDVQKIAAANLDFVEKTNSGCQKILDKLGTVSKKSAPVFEDLLAYLSAQPGEKLPDAVLPLTRYAQAELEAALDYFKQSDGKTTQLTEWKRHWLTKDDNDRFIIDGQRVNRRLQAAAGLYASYQKALADQQLYDYDDMILRAIELLETNPELKYSLAERYSYIMLDEFQDTNPAQFKLVQLLTDHPVHEGRPNILAVGDDDQAIYAFQGAEHANMASFARHYKDVKIIGLKENYRSHQELIDVGHNIAGQINSRLQTEFPTVTKGLVAANQKLPEPPQIEARQFKSDAAQYDWVAGEIARLVKNGLPASEIAVLAPKHRYLLPLLPYLGERQLPVRYERRENILDEPIVRQLEQISRLILALADSDESLASALWPEVLSYDFWQIPTEVIWQISWQARSSREPWTAILLNNKNLAKIAGFCLKLAALLPTTTLEQQLDAIIGLPGASQNLKLKYISPLYNYYFSKSASRQDALEFTKLISGLNVLRARLADWRRGGDRPAGLRAFVEFTEGHRAANLNILNTSPYHETKEAVNLLTAYGAKGREFQAVFIVSAVDEAWGSASRGQGNRLSLPANLTYIRYQGASEDERLRLLYVAATRAKTRLYLTSYSQDLAGKPYNHLKYADVAEDEQGELNSGILPAKFALVATDGADSLAPEIISVYWTQRHLPPFKPRLRRVLAPRLANYQLSATHLNHFTDIVNAGPDSFFINCLLDFPSAPSLTTAFGTAIHNSLRFAGNILTSEGKLPSEERLFEIFNAQLGRVELNPEDQANLARRGRDSLQAWLRASGPRLKPSDRYEYDFASEGSVMDEARLAGKVDRLIIDEKRRQITVVDYKTGQSYKRWQTGIIKLHKFRQQLLVYKLLIENSAHFRKYKVTKGIIEFVEPDEDGQINRLEIDYEAKEVEQAAKLLNAVWNHIQNLDFPDTYRYSLSLTGIRQFEADLTAPPTKNAGS